MSAPAFDDFVDRACRSHAAEERAELYAGTGAVLEDLVPTVFLRHGMSIIARRSRGVRHLDESLAALRRMSEGAYRSFTG